MVEFMHTFCRIMLLAVHRVCVNSFTWKRNPFTRTHFVKIILSNIDLKSVVFFLVKYMYTLRYVAGCIY